ncbi:SPOSA6832_01767 [Sporobolomyces salmonicolor]|uniref:60S ribosomal protein L36 n=1 Tax=Sporidiobolus salmonicolor TaxID=5005 RepID=A0A0D6EKE7_SPOSA|nr:SPOSA6832_01767 [Sporobolomyces salmonicolor]
MAATARTSASPRSTLPSPAAPASTPAAASALRSARPSVPPPVAQTRSSPPVAPADLPWGLNKGHPTTVIPKTAKPSNRKGKQSARSAFVKSIVREVAGFAPYERRVMELIRNSKDKKARKLTKKRVRRRS